MLKKSKDVVEHRPRTVETDCQLNLDWVKDKRHVKTVLMPVNVWDRLFESLNEMTDPMLHIITGDKTLSVAKLKTLQTEACLISLLDKRDCLVAPKSVSSYSLMLRAVLRNIQDTKNTDAFIQLLINITTCTTGKMNGILQSYILLNNGRVLDESSLGSEGFKQEIVHYFTEELRRFREASLGEVVQLLTKSRDPHNIYFLRGVIGPEIGILFEDEVPKVDFNANVVSKELREKSKQELLDLFYGYYKPEDIINRVHTLLNNGTISILDDGSGKNLTMPIINHYLQNDAMDETGLCYNDSLVVVDEERNAIGLTPLAAKKLLIQLGFLNAPKDED